MRLILLALAVLGVFSCGTAASDQREQSSPVNTPPVAKVENTARITGMVQVYGSGLYLKGGTVTPLSWEIIR